MPSRVEKRRKPSQLGKKTNDNTIPMIARTKKQKRYRPIPFFAFPREIRDLVYGYALSTEDTSSQALQPLIATEAGKIREMEIELAEAEHAVGKLVRHRSISALSARTREKKKDACNRLELAITRLGERPRLINTNIFCVNKQMLAELSKYIRERVQVKVLIRELDKKTCTIRELEVMAIAQHVRIVYEMEHRHRRNNWLKPWSYDIERVLADREDIKTFHFEGTGIKILQDSSYEKRDDGYWVRVSGLPPYMDEWSCDPDLYRQIMNVLDDVPMVSASKGLKVSWVGDEKFPENIEDEAIETYRAQVAKLRAGLKA